MPELPVELWSLVASNTERSDLTRLALVSSLLCDVAQDALATDLHLGSSLEKGYRKVLSSLKEKHLLHRTHRLAIDVTEYNIEALDIDAVPVEHMPNLQDLSVRAPKVIFKTAKLQNAFVVRLRKFCRKLQSVSIRLATFEQVLPGKSFAIPNLRKIDWDEGEEPQHHGPCLGLFKLRFPKLTTLKIGPGDDCGCFHTKPNRQQFTQFLIAHSTIEHLTLDQRSLDGTRYNYAYLRLEPDMGSPSILPNIISLKAHPNQVRYFAQAGALFIRTMRKLVIWQNEVGDIVPDVLYMFEVFRAYTSATGPLQLLEFHLLLSHMREGFKIDRAPLKPVLKAVYDVFPSLEIYEGDISDMEDLSLLRTRLKHLRNVQTTWS